MPVRQAARARLDLTACSPGAAHQPALAQKVDGIADLHAAVGTDIEGVGARRRCQVSAPDGSVYVLAGVLPVRTA